jgi:hypothetical protein
MAGGISIELFAVFGGERRTGVGPQEHLDLIDKKL